MKRGIIMAQHLGLPSSILGYVSREICRNFGFLYVVKSMTIAQLPRHHNTKLSPTCFFSLSLSDLGVLGALGGLMRYNLQTIIGAGDV
jgi:hypothetical protein